MKGALARVFLEHVRSGADRLAAWAELEASLEAMVSAGLGAWPGVRLDRDELLRHVAERIPVDGDPAEALAGLHAADLYLACACARGDRRALELFDRQFLSQTSTYLSRSEELRGLADEVAQVVRERLLVGQGGAPPKIADYTGQGALGAFVRVVCLRAALDLRRRRQTRAAGEGEEALRGLTAPDPELQYLETRYGQEVSGALSAALAELPPRQATVLRLHFLDGLAADAVGALYGVHARTVQRWIAQARGSILATVRRGLRERLALGTGEFESLMGLVGSRIDVSVSRLLASTRR